MNCISNIQKAIKKSLPAKKGFVKLLISMRYYFAVYFFLTPQIKRNYPSGDLTGS
jgi:hypothetical protein